MAILPSENKPDSTINESLYSLTKSAEENLASFKELITTFSVKREKLSLKLKAEK